MSTHCGIAVLTEEGYITIYCHNDGYPEHMLPILNNNYNSEELALELVGYGDASFISNKIRPTTPNHSFNTPERDVCIYYHRDRKEPWEQVEPTVYSHHEKKRLLNSFYYMYVYEGSYWAFYKDGKEVYYENT